MCVCACVHVRACVRACVHQLNEQRLAFGCVRACVHACACASKFVCACSSFLPSFEQGMCIQHTHAHTRGAHTHHTHMTSAGAPGHPAGAMCPKSGTSLIGRWGGWRVTSEPMRLDMSVCVCVCAQASEECKHVCACMHICMRVYVRACVRTCVRARVGRVGSCCDLARYRSPVYSMCARERRIQRTRL